MFIAFINVSIGIAASSAEFCLLSKYLYNFIAVDGFERLKYIHFKTRFPQKKKKTHIVRSGDLANQAIELFLVRLKSEKFGRM